MTNVHTAISASLRSFQNHSREYVPNIQEAATSLLRDLESAYHRRSTVSQQSQTYLQRLSSAQERMVSIGPRLAEADDFFTSSQRMYKLLQEVENLANRYGEGLLEGFRRGLWKIRRTRRLEKTRQEIALLRAHERRARKAWGDVSTDGVVWGFVEELSEDEDASPSINGEEHDSPVRRKDIEKYIFSISKSPLFEAAAQSLKEHLAILVSSIQSPTDVATSPLRLDSSDAEIPPLKTREGSEIYEQLLQDKTRAEERARNFESRVKNLEEMLHRQFRTPPRIFSPIPSTTPRPDDEPLLGRSIHPEVGVLQKRIQDMEREKMDLIGRMTDLEGTKNDLMANLEEQTKLFQAEREDLVRKTHGLERELERRETEITQHEEEVDTLRKGRQTLLREMNLLQTESGAKIKELEDAKNVAEDRVAALQRDGENAAAEKERIAGEWRKASSAADDAKVELEKFRRLRDVHQAEHDMLEHLEEELRQARETIADIENEKTTALQDHSTAVAAIRNELSTLRNEIVDILGLEKRRWETDSLIHAISQKLAIKDQHEGTITSLQKETKSLSIALAKSKALCASRTLKARDLTQRLYTQHTRCRQLLETLELQVKSTNGSPLIRHGSEKSDFLEPNDLELLYWMESGDSDEEADKYSRYLGRIVIDLDAFSQSITNRVRDAEKYAKKWQKEARAYRDKAKRSTYEAETKIAFRQFKENDLALFLPTNNGRPWAAFNVNAPHYFLKENEAHRLGGGRDWLLARITKVEERTVDLANHPNVEEHNPFDLADGLRWYYLDAVEEKPSMIASRELARSMSLQRSESRKKNRMSQSTPGLIPGREDGVAVENTIQEE
jgi:autophagy-related protein 11